MKLIYLSFTLLICSVTFGQTNVISNKSHSGDIAEIYHETDNFGMPSESIDTIYAYGENCIIEVGSYYTRDTVCDHPYFVEHGYNLREIKKMYPSYTVFVGFDNDENVQPPGNGWPRQNGVNWFIGLIILSVAGYIFFPSRKKAQN